MLLFPVSHMSCQTKTTECIIQKKLFYKISHLSEILFAYGKKVGTVDNTNIIVILTEHDVL